MIIPTPFSADKLNEIFKISPKDSTRLASRESGWLEFKESFGRLSMARYAKTAASYANAGGGYIVFGIPNNPHCLRGLLEKGLTSFESISKKPEDLTNYLNEHFAPEIKWDIQQYELDNKTFGILYFYEASDKPVICIKDEDKDLKDGSIYYRYRAVSKVIKYPELKSIIEEKRQREQLLWMRHIKKTASIGIRDVGLFNLKTGSVTGSNGSFLIDESLLSQLAFIREGEFSEKKGQPTLKLIGELHTIGQASLNGRKQIIKSKGIRINDIVLDFLNNSRVEEPIEYIKQICYENSGFLPFYYYLSKCGQGKNAVIKEIESIVVRGTAKTKLIERLKNEVDLSSQLPKNEKLLKKKMQILSSIREKADIESFKNVNLKYALQCIRCLEREDIKNNSDYLRSLLRSWFNKHYSTAASTLASELRRSICMVDKELYSE